MSGPTPGISVVIPTHRGGPYLRQAVRSVLAQSFTEYELIVVGDGCPDDLADLELLDDRIRIIRQENRGVSVARNVGVHAAHSDLVAFIDDDDRMLPGRLAAQYEAMAGRPDVGLCHTQFRFIDSDGVPTADGYARPVGFLDLLSAELGVLMPTTLVRRSLLQEVGLFDSALHVAEDVDVILRLARRSELTFLPEVHTEYRLHGTNASGDRAASGQALARLFAKHLRYAQSTGDLEMAAAARRGIDHMRLFTSSAHFAQARQEWRDSHRRQALGLVGAAIRESPSVVARDLIGNRPIRKLFRKAGRA